jgi:hypothetical protein
MIKSIFITAFGRYEVLIKTLKKLKKCKNYFQYNKLLILQKKNIDLDNKVLKNIKKIDDEIKIISTEYSARYTIFSKVNNNVYLGFKELFDKYKSDYVIHLEDDILPAYDFLVFNDELIKRYSHDNKFFGINGFSKEYILKKEFNFSKFIYGIGKGWSVPKNRWQILKKYFSKVLKKNTNSFFDTEFESEIKRNFYVIMPYRSRTFEQPSTGVNSLFSDKNNAFNYSWKKSFLSKKEYKIKDYIFEKNMKFTWREDCKTYNIKNIFKFKLLKKLIKLINILKRNTTL